MNKKTSQVTLTEEKIQVKTKFCAIHLSTG